MSKGDYPETCEDCSFVTRSPGHENCSHPQADDCWPGKCPLRFFDVSSWGEGDKINRRQADFLPDGSVIQRSDGPGIPYKPLTKEKGLWVALPHGVPLGIGTAVWERWPSHDTNEAT